MTCGSPQITQESTGMGSSFMLITKSIKRSKQTEGETTIHRHLNLRVIDPGGGTLSRGLSNSDGYVNKSWDTFPIVFPPCDRWGRV